jgi:uncharacterized integral membrane protein
VNQPTSPEPGRSSRLSLGAIASVSGVALLVIFMLQNRDDVRLDFLAWGFTWPLWLLTLVSAAVGAAVWFGLGVVRRHNRRKGRREARRG